MISRDESGKLDPGVGAAGGCGIRALVGES